MSTGRRRRKRRRRRVNGMILHPRETSGRRMKLEVLEARRTSLCLSGREREDLEEKEKTWKRKRRLGREREDLEERRKERGRG